jgi:uncharacterized protein (TIGR02646 family)
MKYIRKGGTPRELEAWFKNCPMDENGTRMNCSYEHDMPGDVREAIKEELLKEQGWLCCYTGLSVDETSSHIEHFKPQTLCRQEDRGKPEQDKKHEDVDYKNLLAAYPSPNMPHCRFGAHAKDKWYDKQLLVSPLTPQCGMLFTFDQCGRIFPKDETEQAVTETIRRLCLDDGSLTEMRRQAIEEYLLPETHKLSKSQLRKIVKDYCTQREQVSFQLLNRDFEGLNNEGIPPDILQNLRPIANQSFAPQTKFLNAIKKQIGEDSLNQHERLLLKYAQKVRKRFPKFCFVIVHAAKQILHKAERRHKRREAMHRQGLI